MRVSIYCAVVLLNFILAEPVWAHSKPSETWPANNAVLAALPDTLEMMFDKGIRLTRVVLSVPGQEPTDLDLSNLSGFVTEASVPMAGSGAGEYLIEWRGLSIDGHAMQDEIRFTVTGE